MEAVSLVCSIVLRYCTTLHTHDPGGQWRCEPLCRGQCLQIQWATAHWVGTESASPILIVVPPPMQIAGSKSHLWRWHTWRTTGNMHIVGHQWGNIQSISRPESRMLLGPSRPQAQTSLPAVAGRTRASRHWMEVSMSCILRAWNCRISIGDSIHVVNVICGRRTGRGERCHRRVRHQGSRCSYWVTVRGDRSRELMLDTSKECWEWRNHLWLTL